MLEEDLGVRIGLEIHVPLRTKQKLFCDCPTDYYRAELANVNTCPVCTGMPGAKPYPINGHAIESALMIARLLNCEVKQQNIFVKRKHYNYPDLPSGYQRTSEPLGVDGRLSDVGIWEVHLEEDPGRYDLASGRVDYNRSGVPLVEIVTAPDMKSPEDVRAFLKELMNLLRYTERIIDVGGVVRMDVNISLAGGARVEIKNINSVRGAYKAIKYEIIRQKNMRKRGQTVRQETRGFNEKSMITIPLRVKETAEDYRYIPDPDIPPLLFKESYIEAVPLPETPQTRRKRLMEKYGVPEKYSSILVKDKDIADLFEAVAERIDPEMAAKWVCREVLSQLNYRGIEFSESKLDSGILIELLDLIGHGRITENTGKKLLERVIDSGESPKKVFGEEGLGRVHTVDDLSNVVEDVLRENPEAVQDFRDGKNGVLNFLMGQVMKKMHGRADVKTVISLLRERLGH
ncbi:MAG: Asp-tRNA(Asn)/Glu-tRNA(Gln) amidotransferase subunit GatB [Candidatus Altiarchaeota archaeon]|nr:Asp-tRNA(Asn)/Glu-tRNA(Gln) amidotransferase subunit GatB [Candidatus Altiarchaeota archaeon]